MGAGVARVRLVDLGLSGSGSVNGALLLRVTRFAGRSSAAGGAEALRLGAMIGGE